MKIQALNNKYVCILGYGKEGQAVLEAMTEDAPKARICIADANLNADIPTNVEKQCGANWLKDLNRFDTLIVSPGIPPCSELDAVENKCTNSTDLFLSEALENNALIIGVTGTKGKSTTSSLLAHILKHCQSKTVLLLGNIGTPSISHRKQCTANCIIVLEMSSYQLLRVKNSPQIAVITSFFEDHLDYHGQEKSVRALPMNEQHTAAIAAYKRAKMHICQYQTDTHTTYFDTSTLGARDIASVSNGMTIATSASDCPVSLSETQLHGEHNLRNMALASVVCEQLGCPLECIKNALRSFTPLPHRLQSLGIYNKAEWIDDAISTTAESTIAAIEALQHRVQVIILGGQDRGIDFSGLAKYIITTSIEHIVLLPDSGKRIRASLEKAQGVKTLYFYEANSMEEVINHCVNALSKISRSETTPAVLLSTASPSYNMFKNFEDKGEQFAKLVKMLDKQKYQE